MRTDEAVRDGIDLYWLPLGAGTANRTVRWSGKIYEAIVARRERRRPCDLYHSALEVRLDGDRFVIEMTPTWGFGRGDRGVVREGAVGLAWLGRSRLFRFEVRRWLDGEIADRSEAVDSPHHLSASSAQARRLLDLVPDFPTATWGRDELDTGEMWNSNSLVSWLLARTGHDVDAIAMPVHGRAPGWSAGVVVARRQQRDEYAEVAEARPLA